MPRAQGRIFTMTEQDADASIDVVIGTISLFSRDIRVLFDYGVIHSFISMTFSYYAVKTLSH